jgi:hypothetical protein
MRPWLWLGTGLNAILLLPAAFMAFSAVGFALAYGGGTATMVALLFLALPIFCVLAPYRAWRLHQKRRRDLNAAFMMAAPLVYAAFIAAFLAWN